MRKTLPKISIVTPSFNQGKFIKQTIESVITQNYPDIEYWVIDGGSTDETVDILKSYGQMINWISEEDSGQTDAINKGFSRCTGDILCYINSDDYFLPGTLQAVGEFFAEHRDASWATGDYIIVDEHGRQQQQAIVIYKRLLRLLPFASVHGIANGIAQPSTFWRKDLAAKLGPFDENLRYCMDYDYWQRAFSLASLDVLPNTLSAFRIHQDSKGGSQYTAQFAEEAAVLSRYTNNLLIRFLHAVHAYLVIAVYKVLK